MRKLRMSIVAATILAIVGVGMPTALATAESCPRRFGSPEQLVDAGGAVVQEWTVTDLRASTDAAPGYPLAGRLWEASASVKAVTGTVTPLIPNFEAMSTSLDRYPVLWQLANPSGIPGTTLAQGQTSTGKLYFDVTGADPAAVHYRSSVPMPAMMWCGKDVMMPMAN